MSTTFSSRTRSRFLAGGVALVLCVCVAPVTGFAFASDRAPKVADRADEKPKELDEVGVTEHLGVQVPKEISFVDSSGKAVKIGEFFDGRRPVLLTINYSNCPMLCSLQLSGLFRGLEGMPWNLGQEYQMITVSMDPAETSQRAAKTKEKYLKIYGRPGVADGWHVLTGHEADIRRLAGTVGFGYKYQPDSKQFAHPAVTFVLSPEGMVSRYLYGVDYDPQTLRLSLVEASEGKTGSTVDQVILFCFHYDASKGRYGPAAMQFVRLGGVLTILAILAMFVGFYRMTPRTPLPTAAPTPANAADTPAAGEAPSDATTQSPRSTEPPAAP
jgi:protein SCO1/2